MSTLSKLKMTAPDGSIYWVNNTDVNEAIRKGLRPASDTGSLTVENIFTKEQEDVNTNEVSSKINQGGHRYVGFDEQIGAIKPEETTLTGVERVGTALTGLNPFGVNDIISGSINKVIDYAQGRDPNETNRKLAELREQDKTVQLAANIVSGIGGGIVTGGMANTLASRVGTGALSRIGAAGLLNGLDGMSYAVGRDLGEATLGNPEINAERLMASAKAGFLWGGGASLIAPSIGYGVSKITRQGVKEASGKLPLLVLDEVSPDPNSLFKTINIYDAEKGVIAGNARLAINNPNSIHQVGKHGVSLEELNLNPNYIGTRASEAVVGELVNKFGRVATSSTSREIPDNISNTFKYLGNRHMAEDGVEYMVATRSPKVEFSTADEMIETYGKYLASRMPDTEGAVVLRDLFNKRNTEFRKKVFDYYNNPESRLLDSTQSVQKMADLALDVKRVAENLKTEVLTKFNTDLTPKLKAHIWHQKLDVDEMVARSTQIMDEFSPRTIAILKRKSIALQSISNQTDGVSMLQSLRKQSKDLGADIAAMRKSDFPPEDINMLSNLRRKIDDDIIRNPEITGDVAEAWISIQRRQAAVIEQTKKFSKRYTGKEDLSKADISPERIRNIINAKSHLPTAKAVAEDEAYLRTMREFIDELEGTSNRLGIEVPSTLKQRDVFNKTFIDDLRNQNKASKVLLQQVKDKGSSDWVDGVMTGAMSSTGVAFANLAGLPWFLGAASGMAGATAFRKGFTDPVKMLRVIEGISEKTTNFHNTIKKLSNIVPSRTLNPAVTSSKALERIGINVGLSKEYSKDYAKLYTALSKKLDVVSSESINGSFEGVSEAIPEHTVAILNKSMAVKEYVKNNLPPPPRKMKDHRHDIKKMYDLVDSAFNPLGSLERFMLTGDRQAILHTKELYPNIIAEMATKYYENVDNEDLDYRTIDRLNTLFGTNVKKSSTKVLFRELYNIARNGQEEASQGGGGVKPTSQTHTQDFQTATDRLSE
jgi:hypothetical protein